MKITFISDLFMSSIQNTISILTDKAKICVKDIHYDEANGAVKIYMQTKEILEFKETVLGELKPIYSQATIKSLLTIRQVEEMDLKVDDRLVADCNSCFTLLFGVRLDDKQLYFGSAEEIQGENLCQIFIKVKQMNFEFSDVVETEPN